MPSVSTHSMPTSPGMCASQSMKSVGLWNTSAEDSPGGTTSAARPFASRLSSTLRDRRLSSRTTWAYRPSLTALATARVHSATTAPDSTRERRTAALTEWIDICVRRRATVRIMGAPSTAVATPKTSRAACVVMYAGSFSTASVAANSPRLTYRIAATAASIAARTHTGRQRGMTTTEIVRVSEVAPSLASSVNSVSASGW